MSARLKVVEVMAHEDGFVHRCEWLTMGRPSWLPEEARGGFWIDLGIESEEQPQPGDLVTVSAVVATMTRADGMVSVEKADG